MENLTNETITDEPEITTSTQGLVATQDRFFSIIEKMALITDADVDKMAKIWELQERSLDREARTAFAAALVQAQGSIPNVVKDKVNPQTKSRYVGYDALIKVVGPELRKHGFSLAFREEDTGNPALIKLVGILTHYLGHQIEFPYICPMDAVGIGGNRNKTDVHGKASAVSYAKRYIILMIVPIPLLEKGEDDDGNRAGGYVEPTPVVLVNDSQVNWLTGLLEKACVDESILLGSYKVDKLENLNITQYESAVKRLNLTISKLINEVKDE